jgi:hypothetical protein
VQSWGPVGGWAFRAHQHFAPTPACTPRLVVRAFLAHQLSTQRPDSGRPSRTSPVVSGWFEVSQVCEALGRTRLTGSERPGGPGCIRPGGSGQVREALGHTWHKGSCLWGIRRSSVHQVMLLGVLLDAMSCHASMLLCLQVSRGGGRRGPTLQIMATRTSCARVRYSKS